MKILLAHGSTASAHGEQLAALAAKVSALLGIEVGTAFLSDDALSKGATVLPLFLGEGKHVYEDLPKLAALSDCTVLSPLANHAEAIADLVLAALTKDTRRIHALFVMYRFGGFEQLIAALYGKAKICSKHALASLHTEPGVDVLLQHWQQEGVKAISLQPMLLFEGHSLDRLQTMVSESNIAVSMAPVLSDLAGFPELIADIFKDGVGDKK
ncbi:MAG: hypothetical protein Q9M16_08180 [Mariprofundus sp.]|nr:hypothetical protein [Mariprofundus sp.]